MLAQKSRAVRVHRRHSAAAHNRLLFRSRIVVRIAVAALFLFFRLGFAALLFLFLHCLFDRLEFLLYAAALFFQSLPARFQGVAAGQLRAAVLFAGSVSERLRSLALLPPGLFDFAAGAIGFAMR